MLVRWSVKLAETYIFILCVYVCMHVFLTTYTVYAGTLQKGRHDLCSREHAGHIEGVELNSGVQPSSPCQMAFIQSEKTKQQIDDLDISKM